MRPKPRPMIARLLAVLAASPLVVGATLQGAPLRPLNTDVNLQIDGQASIDANPTRQPFGYQFSGSANEFTSGGTYLSSSVANGNTPGLDHSATIGSTTGVQWEQIAANEYVLTLSSAAHGSLVRGSVDITDEVKTFCALGRYTVLSPPRSLRTPGRLVAHMVGWSPI